MIEQYKGTADKYSFDTIEIDEERKYNFPAIRVQAALTMQKKRKFPDRNFMTRRTEFGIIVKRLA